MYLERLLELFLMIKCAQFLRVEETLSGWLPVWSEDVPKLQKMVLVLVVLVVET